MYSNVSHYMDYLFNRITILFASKSEPFEEFPLVVRRDMFYDDLTACIAETVRCDPDYLLLISPDCYGNPKKAIRRVRDMTLSDILALLPQQKDMDDNRVTPRLYYEHLPISLSEYESKKLIKLNFCYPTLNQFQVQEFFMPKLARISDIYSAMHNTKTVRIFQVADNKLVKVFTGTDIVPDDESDLFAEIIPKEELEVGEQDFYVSVYHYQKELKQTHSVPFKFLVIKVKYHRPKV